MALYVNLITERNVALSDFMRTSQRGKKKTIFVTYIEPCGLRVEQVAMFLLLK